MKMKKEEVYYRLKDFKLIKKGWFVGSLVCSFVE